MALGIKTKLQQKMGAIKNSPTSQNSFSPSSRRLQHQVNSPSTTKPSSTPASNPVNPSSPTPQHASLYTQSDLKTSPATPVTSVPSGKQIASSHSPTTSSNSAISTNELFFLHSAAAEGLTPNELKTILKGSGGGGIIQTLGYKNAQEGQKRLENFIDSQYGNLLDNAVNRYGRKDLTNTARLDSNRFGRLNIDGSANSIGAAAQDLVSNTLISNLQHVMESSTPHTYIDRLYQNTPPQPAPPTSLEPPAPDSPSPSQEPSQTAPVTPNINNQTSAPQTTRSYLMPAIDGTEASSPEAAPNPQEAKQEEQLIATATSTLGGDEPPAQLSASEQTLEQTARVVASTLGDSDLSDPLLKSSQEVEAEYDQLEKQWGTKSSDDDADDYSHVGSTLGGDGIDDNYVNQAAASPTNNSPTTDSSNPPFPEPPPVATTASNTTTDNSSSLATAPADSLESTPSVANATVSSPEPSPTATTSSTPTPISPLAAAAGVAASAGMALTGGSPEITPAAPPVSTPTSSATATTSAPASSSAVTTPRATGSALAITGGSPHSTTSNKKDGTNQESGPSLKAEKGSLRRQQGDLSTKNLDDSRRANDWKKRLQKELELQEPPPATDTRPSSPVSSSLSPKKRSSRHQANMLDRLSSGAILLSKKPHRSTKQTLVSPAATTSTTPSAPSPTAPLAAAAGVAASAGMALTGSSPSATTTAAGTTTTPTSATLATTPSASNLRAKLVGSDFFTPHSRSASTASSIRQQALGDLGSSPHQLPISTSSYQRRLNLGQRFGSFYRSYAQRLGKYTSPTRMASLFSAKAAYGSTLPISNTGGSSGDNFTAAGSDINYAVPTASPQQPPGVLQNLTRAGKNYLKESAQQKLGDYANKVAPKPLANASKALKNSRLGKLAGKTNRALDKLNRFNPANLKNRIRNKALKEVARILAHLAKLIAQLLIKLAALLIKLALIAIKIIIALLPYILIGLAIFYIGKAIINFFAAIWDYFFGDDDNTNHIARVNGEESTVNPEDCIVVKKTPHTYQIKDPTPDTEVAYNFSVRPNGSDKTEIEIVGCKDQVEIKCSEKDSAGCQNETRDDFQDTVCRHVPNGPLNGEIKFSENYKLPRVGSYTLINTFTVQAKCKIKDKDGNEKQKEQTAEAKARVCVGDKCEGGDLCWPVSGRISQSNYSGVSHSHSDALDVADNKDSDIYAPTDGDYTYRFQANGAGCYVKVNYTKDGQSYTILIMHMRLVPECQSGTTKRNVRQGELIGHVGKTGRVISSRPGGGHHAHVEVRPGGGSQSNSNLFKLFFNGDIKNKGESVSQTCR